MSAQRDLRKKYASKVEAEITTIQFEMDNMSDRLKTADLKTLKRLNYDTLKSLRECLQSVQREVKSFNRKLDNISKPHLRGSIILQSDDQQEILVDQLDFENEKNKSHE